MYSRRSREAGCWVAPANLPFTDVVAVAPRFPPGRARDVQDALVNELVAAPRGFLARNALTLADPGSELDEANVRRLLQLLRRLALREGADYVFEPVSPAFRRSVKAGFERVLGGLYARGAFAGASADAAFQVVTGAEVNPPTQVDQGRFVVELRVAPSHPLRFLTVRLVRSDTNGLGAEGA
jgi:phage tail sheath protein FI